MKCLFRSFAHFQYCILKITMIESKEFFYILDTCALAHVPIAGIAGIFLQPVSYRLFYLRCLLKTEYSRLAGSHVSSFSFMSRALCPVSKNLDIQTHLFVFGCFPFLGGVLLFSVLHTSFLISKNNDMVPKSS